MEIFSIGTLMKKLIFFFVIINEWFRVSGYINFSIWIAAIHFKKFSLKKISFFGVVWWYTMTSWPNDAKNFDYNYIITEDTSLLSI
jgi:hypothetical protein